MHHTREDRNKHLEFIQTTIHRMATNSFILKGWSVTLISGIIALSLTTSATNFIYLAFIPALTFWGLDAFYLRQERLYRKLYDSVRKNTSKKIEPFSLDTNVIKKDVKNWWCTLFSTSILALHFTIIVILIIIALCK